MNNKRVFPTVLSNNTNHNYIRKFDLECNCYYIEEVTCRDFIVVHTEYSNGVFDNEVFSKYKGFHNIGDKLKGGLYESLVEKSPSKSLVELVNEQAEQISVDSNSELLGEIFDDIIPSTTNPEFTTDDVYTSQVAGRVNRLEEALKRLLDVMENMNKHMEKLEKDNQSLTSLVTQVLNHQVPEEMAKSVLEDMFKEL